MRKAVALLPPLLLLACGHRAAGPAPAPTAVSAPPPDAAVVAAPDAGDARRDRVQALAERLQRRVAEALGSEVDSDALWTSAERAGFLAAAPLGVLAVAFRLQRVDALPLAIYVLSPWQPLVEAPRRENLLSARLVTVTEEALVFEPASPVQASDASRVLRAKIEKIVAEVVDLEKNQAPRDMDVPLPAGLQVISTCAHRHHVVIEVALPGTRMPPAAELARLAKDRMVCLILTPDTGPKREQWIAPGEAPEIQAAPAPPPSPFGDYRPKTTPDTVRDYRPAIGQRIDELPPANPASLADLVRLLDQQAARARQKPGRWIGGNMILGADRREYKPSDEELLESEIGTRIREIVSRPDATAALAKLRPKRAEVSFREITVRHADVMGSGRFFYASAPVRTRVSLRGR